MSRWTSGPDDPEAGDGANRSRRGRRAGRSRDANDFREKFGTPPADAPAPGHGGPGPAHPSLREPRSADRFVRGRTRLTVRELMEQMNAEETSARSAGQTPPASRRSDAGRPDDPRSSRPRAPAPGPGAPRPEAPNPATPPTTRGRRFAPPPLHPTSAPPEVPPRARRDPGQPDPDDRPTAVHHFGNDVTQKIPTIGDAAPDLSDRATEKRVIEESRAQDPLAAAAPAAGAVPKEPLEPTPDLTGPLELRSRPRRHPAAREDRRGSLVRKATSTGRILVAIACVTALVGTGFVWNYLQSWNGNWRNVTAVDSEDKNIRKKDAQYGDETYLIVGTDTRGGKNAKVGAGTTDDAEGARADTIILVNIPANRSRVVAVSFPRDLQVDRPACNAWDNDNGSYGAEMPAEYGVKLNSVYFYGGPQCLVRTITEMSGLNINHFIGMDFYGFEKVVRAIGGVEVCSTVPLYDYELGQILRKPGKQKLTGRRALNYVRARTIASEGTGDYGRIKRQQLFMSSLLRSSLSGNVLSNPNKLNSIVNTFIEYSYVDGVNTQSLLKLAESMQGIEAGRVSFLTIPTSGTSTDGANNEIPRTDDVDAIFNAIIDDLPLPGEKARKKPSSSSSSKAPAPSAPRGSSESPGVVNATAQSPGNVGVRVLNGTGKTGLAAEVSDQLTPYGFDVRGVADASENRDDTVVRYGPGQRDAAATLASMFPGASVQLDRTVKSGVELIVGGDFAGSLESAPDSGATLTVDQLPRAENTGNLPNDLAITNAGDTTCS
ncbi:LCP family protein [Gordonia sp. zg691]|uniref:LCP family protein n=1 Tax=Gordonia jinghuaiqii TaxID=2758710 RepID=A0A7D7LT37_9ACTN|nr:LCP family protein [Gordonia jinghuaiqii]MBD0861098.1 LCP family protein [Gordonia jinghuaiqii]MCR5979742.1 LytR family transcriptional regulator [Gordonia jinghuaiqii]QMT00861.1 LCP family protein [Gordonia jinghuaiqii]